MANAMLDGNVTDQNEAVVPGALIYVYDPTTGGLADLFDSMGQVATNPVTAGEDGYWSAFAETDRFYTLKYYWGGRNRLNEANVLLGAAAINTDPNVRADLAATTGAAQIGTTAGTVQAALDARRQQIATLTGAQAIPPDVTQTLVDVMGYALADDRGNAPFVRVNSEPAHDLKFQDAAGNWYELYVENRIQARAFGIGLGGDDVAGMNRLIAYLNAKGSISPTAYKMLGVDFGQCDEIDVTAGGINPLLVSNVCFIAGRDTRVNILAAPFLTLGQATPSSLKCENIFILGFAPTVDTGATVGGVGQAAFLKVINAARVFIEGCRPYNLPHIVYCDLAAGGGASTIWIQNIYGLGQPDYSWVHLVNNNGAIGASLYYSRVNGYPYAPPTNPAIVPKAVTGITRANPGVVTCTGHGFTSGVKVRLGDAAGMTEVNGNDYTVTVIDANSFSIGVDTSGFTAYTSGGWAAGLHWSISHDKAMIYIEGQWDTVRLSDNICQHWAYFYELKTNSAGPLSFIYDWHNIVDYVGQSRYKITLNTNAINHFQILGGWTFTLNGPFDTYSRTSGNINTQEILGHHIGLTGGDVFADTGNGFRYRNIKNVEVHGCGRAKSGTTYGVNCAGANNEWDLGGIEFVNPDDYYGIGASTYLLPDTCLRDPGTSPRLTVDGFNARASTRYYDVTTATGSTQRRRFSNCIRSDGALAGVARLVTFSAVVGSNTWRNKTGLPAYVVPNGVTITAASISYVDSSGVEQTATGTGITTGPWTVGNDQLLTLTASTTGTIRAFPINL